LVACVRPDDRLEAQTIDAMKSGAVIAFLATAALAPAGSLQEVDVELVLAVDISRSMNPSESALQRRGYVEALSDPAFARAIEAGLIGKIAITYVEWAGFDSQEVTIDWQVIDGSESALAFAKLVEAAPLSWARGTSISGAIDFSVKHLANNSFKGIRTVIDVSGDGPNNIGRPILHSRADALAAGLTINGLPILLPGASALSTLDEYYSDCVIGGPGAFSLPARGMEEFAVSIRRKLILEVAGLVPTQSIPVDDHQKSDCLIGEKMREHLLREQLLRN
jgi:hypothetical protein